MTWGKLYSHLYFWWGNLLENMYACLFCVLESNESYCQHISNILHLCLWGDQLQRMQGSWEVGDVTDIIGMVVRFLPSSCNVVKHSTWQRHYIPWVFRLCAHWLAYKMEKNLPVLHPSPLSLFTCQFSWHP